jgi:hypothetical protein
MEILVDFKLTQGHPLVFMPFSHEFYQQIERTISE